MKARTVLGVLAVGVGLMSLPNDAEARQRHRSSYGHRSRHSSVHIGFGVGISHYYRAQPIYGVVDPGYESDGGYYSDPYYDDGSYSDDGYYDRDYGYSRYYRAPYVAGVYVRTPRIVLHDRGSRRSWRTHRHVRYRY